MATKKIISKADLIDEIAEKTKLSKKDSNEALSAAIEAIKSAVKKGNEVRLVGFATLKTVQRKAMVKRNPKTQKEINVPAKRVAKAKLSKTFLD